MIRIIQQVEKKAEKNKKMKHLLVIPDKYIVFLFQE